MTNADKTELENLIRNVASMKKTAENANTPYYDTKISIFAKDAVRNYNETKAEILKMIRKNIAIFLDLKKMPFRRGCFPKYVDRGDVDSVCVGRMLNIYYRIHTDKDWNDIVYDTYGGSGWYSIDPDEVEITDVWAYTSDSKLPEYKVCSNWSLTYQKNDEFDLDGLYNSADWHTIYCLATWTKAQTELLVKEFKTTLELQADKYRGVANKADEFKERNTSVGAYVKVTM